MTDRYPSGYQPIDPFWCKHCQTEFLVQIDQTLTGDAFILCPTCGWRHPRQFVNGVAVSCDLPHGEYITITRTQTCVGI